MAEWPVTCGFFVWGAGAWGSACAIHLARSHPQTPVYLWARDASQIRAMTTLRSNAQYLPGHGFPDNLYPTEALLPKGSGSPPTLVVIATPALALRAMLTQAQVLLPSFIPRIWLCKGFEAQTGALGHEIAAQVCAGAATGILSGPSFAQEVAAGMPCALVAASEQAEVTTAVTQAFHSAAMRIYHSNDCAGVEIGGAVKNVMAIATGLCDGLGLGHNARAALVTRGLAEMTRLGVALGARAETFMGLSGLGDLMLTTTGDLSRNRKVGLLLAQGQSAVQAAARLGHVAEGVYSAPTVLQRAQRAGVDMPITQAVCALLEGSHTPQQVLQMLLGRDAKAEFTT